MQHPEQYPDSPKPSDGDPESGTDFADFQYAKNFADPEDAKKSISREHLYMNQEEQDEFLLTFGTRKERMAIKERRKAREQAKKQST
jgi:hypothetical protein